MITRIFLASIILTSIVLPAVPIAADENRPKVGLVLSGGGARGGAHVGVLKALEKLEVPIDYIAGTSMGAIIGGLYASGYTAGEIETVLVGSDWQRGLTDSPKRKHWTMRKKELDSQFLIPYRMGFNGGKVQLPLGAISGQHLDQVFQDLFFKVEAVKDFAQLPIPFRAVATDLVTGDEVVLSAGSLPDALHASMAVPGVFAPVRIDDRLLADGGMSNNLPVSVVREMGADIVIAVDISSPMLNEEQLTSVLSVTEQLTNFLTRRSTDAQIALLQPGDLLITPDLGNFSPADFTGIARIVGTGESSTLAERNKLQGIAGLAGAPDRPDSQSQHSEHYRVSFIDLDNGSVLNDELILSRLSVKEGDLLDVESLERSLDEIYSLDVFMLVNYDLVQNEDGESGLLIKAIPREWGPNYLQFGLELSSDFSGNSEFKLGAAYTRNALNSLGGELRVVASMGREDEVSFDFYQPIDLSARWFVQPVLYWQRENYNLWDGDSNIATLEISGWGADFAFGRNFGSTHRVLTRYRHANAESTVLTGSTDLDLDGNFDIGELELQYRHDSLDSPWFPTSGAAARMVYVHADEALGASKDYEQASVVGSLAWSRGLYTGLFNYELGYSFDDAAPVERWYRLGGLGRLSGLVPNQLLGRQLTLFSLAAYRELKDYRLVKLYTGATLEAGNLWDSSDDIALDELDYAGSLFVGAETPIGPMYLALGYHEGGDAAVYFYLGNPFRISRFD